MSEKVAVLIKIIEALNLDPIEIDDLTHYLVGSFWDKAKKEAVKMH